MDFNVNNMFFKDLNRVYGIIIKLNHTLKVLFNNIKA